MLEFWLFLAFLLTLYDRREAIAAKLDDKNVLINVTVSTNCTCTCTYPVVNDRWGATNVATLSLNFILFSASLLRRRKTSNYFQANTSQAPLWENKEHLSSSKV